MTKAAAVPRIASLPEAYNALMQALDLIKAVQAAHLALRVPLTTRVWEPLIEGRNAMDAATRGLEFSLSAAGLGAAASEIKK